MNIQSFVESIFFRFKYTTVMAAKRENQFKMNFRRERKIFHVSAQHLHSTGKLEFKELEVKYTGEKTRLLLNANAFVELQITEIKVIRQQVKE